MKITRKQLQRIIREAIAPHGESSLASRAAQEFAQLSPDDVDMVNTPLTTIHPNLDLYKIFGQQSLEYIDLTGPAMEAFQESLPQISEFLKMIMGSESESITDYIQSILVHAEFRTDGSVIRRTFYKGGQKHRDGDLPAQISYDESGAVDGETWYQNGIMHRDGDRPAAVHISSSGTIETYFKQGKRHREGDAPAVLAINADGEPIDQIWYKNGLQHREGDQPARIMRSYYGDLIEYSKNGEFHREGDLPARITTSPAGRVKEENYYVMGLQHREGGKPAMIYYNSDGTAAAWEFWVQGKEQRYNNFDAKWNEEWRGINP